MLTYANPTPRVRVDLSASDCAKLLFLLDERAAQTEALRARNVLLRLIWAIGDAQHLAWWKRESVCLLLDADEASLLLESISQRRFLGEGFEVAADWKHIAEALLRAVGSELAAAAAE